MYTCMHTYTCIRINLPGQMVWLTACWAANNIRTAILSLSLSIYIFPHIFIYLHTYKYVKTYMHLFKLFGWLHAGLPIATGRPYGGLELSIFLSLSPYT